MPTDSEDDQLIAWFHDRDLPKGQFRVTPWITTDNLDNMVRLAIDNIRRGNPTARDHLKLVKDKLNEPGTPILVPNGAIQPD